MTALRDIVEFVEDDAGDWIAVLACGHRQHVRHRPPIWPKPWALTEHGRESRLGTPLHCRECEEVGDGACFLQEFDD